MSDPPPGDGSPLHASAVAIAGKGLLITGGSGSGKSALALALIARGARLVADDRVALQPGPDGVTLSAPSAIAGLVEARGIGLIRLDHTPAPLALIADLDRPPEGRLPAARWRTLLGQACPVLSCGGMVGLADALTVLMRDGALLDPDAAEG